MNGRHVHTTEVYISLQSSGGLHVVFCISLQWSKRSSCGLIAYWILTWTSSLVTWSLYEMRSIFAVASHFNGLYSSWNSAVTVKVHDSQAYRKMDVTKERFGRVLELREIFLSFKTVFSLVNAAVICAILESISRLEPSYLQVLAAFDCLKLLSLLMTSTHR